MQVFHWDVTKPTFEVNNVYSLEWPCTGECDGEERAACSTKCEHKMLEQTAATNREIKSGWEKRTGQVIENKGNGESGAPRGAVAVRSEGWEPARPRSWRLCLTPSCGPWRCAPHPGTSAQGPAGPPGSRSCREGVDEVGRCWEMEVVGVLRPRDAAQAAQCRGGGCAALLVGAPAHRQLAVSGSDMRIDSMRPPVFRPKMVPRSYTRLNSV